MISHVDFGNLDMTNSSKLGESLCIPMYSAGQKYRTFYDLPVIPPAGGGLLPKFTYFFQGG